jgi:hypothetical protein
MRHALRYHGGFERNFEGLKPGARKFEGTDGSEHTLPDWPSKADGIRVSYMEKAGKRFAAVRVEYGSDDVVLGNEVLLEPGRHMGFGQRLSPEPTEIGDEVALALLDDIIARNPDQRPELEPLRSQLRAKARGQSGRPRADETAEDEPETTDRAP